MSPIYVPGKVVLAKQFTWNESVWNPSMITTALWLDAADASSITLASGAVSQWNDKSGNGRNVSQSDSLLRPTVLPNAFNNKQSIVFSGSSNCRLLGGATGLTSTASIFVAVQDTGSTSTIAGIYSSGISGGGFGIYRTTANIVTVDGIGANTTNSANSTSAISQPSIIAGIYTQANTNGTSIFFNGTLEETFASTGVTVDSPPTNFEIGGRSQGQPARVFQGNISEVIVLGLTASSDTRQRIEGYLAHKWGLEANLPNDHPYKTTGPTP
jgi:hypothetical protein